MCPHIHAGLHAPAAADLDAAQLAANAAQNGWTPDLYEKYAAAAYQEYADEVYADIANSEPNYADYRRAALGRAQRSGSAQGPPGAVPGGGASGSHGAAKPATTKCPE